MNEISAEELKERVAIVKRFRELLREQRDRFRAYLESLDKQKAAITGGSTEDILSYVELQEKILSDIFSIQKVIDPLEPLYRRAPNNIAPDVPEIQSALENLKTETSVKVKQNRDILEKRMASLKEELKTLQTNPYTKRRSAFNAPEEASLVDIKG
jgi:glutamyl-tRNA reductase